MIVVQQRPDEETRAPGKSCYWVASTIVDGVTYRARSRHGAPNELALALVAAGIPDAPMQVHSAELRGHTDYRSFHKLAGYTFEENAQMALKRRRYRVGAGDLTGVVAPAATPVAFPILDAAE
jgi:hypothetical protein